MAIAVTNIASATAISGASTTRAYGSAVTAGSTLVAGGFNYDSTPASPTISSSNNGSWTVKKYGQLTADTNLEVWLATKENATAGADTVTWDPPGTADMGGWFICEITGVATASTTDVTPAVSQTNGVTPSVASGTLAQAAEALFAVMGAATANPVVTIAGDGTYTQLVNNGDNATQAGQAQYKIVASTASDTADWTITDGGGGGVGKVSILISIKEATGGGATRGLFRVPPMAGLGGGGSFFRDPLQGARA